MTAQLQSPWIYLADSDGEPLVGAKVRVYEPETTTPLDIFSDPACEVGDVVAQPIIADAAGRITRYYVQQSYKMTVHTSADVLVSTLDNQDLGLPSGFGVSATVQVAQGGTGATNAAAARTNLGAASAASLTSVQDTVTDHDTKIDTGLNVSDPTRFGLLAKEDTVTRTLLASGFGIIEIQDVRDSTPNANTTTTTTPAWDTSVPQISEGTEIFSVSITPLSASSVIEIHAHLQLEATSAVVVGALFLNSDAGAIAASAASTYGGTVNPLELNIRYRVSAGSTAARTYSVRLGTSAGTVRVNASGGTGTLGGVIGSFLSAKEKLTV